MLLITGFETLQYIIRIEEHIKACKNIFILHSSSQYHVQCAHFLHASSSMQFGVFLYVLQI